MSTGVANPSVQTQNSIPTRTIFVGDYGAADEGSYYHAWLAATASTAIATTTQALGTTAPSFLIFNGNPAGGYNIYLRALRIRMTAVTTGTTTVEHVGVLNSDSATFTSGGTQFNGPFNVNSASGTTSRAQVWGGAIVAKTPGVASRICHAGPVAELIPIALDAWTFMYGSPDLTSSNNAIGTTGASRCIQLPPVIIAPQWYYTIGFWGASWAAAAPTYRTSIEFIERPSGQ